MFRRTLSDDEKIEIHRLYTQSTMSEEAARMLLGTELDDIARERDALRRRDGTRHGRRLSVVTTSQIPAIILYYIILIVLSRR